MEPEPEPEPAVPRMKEPEPEPAVPRMKEPEPEPVAPVLHIWEPVPEPPVPVPKPGTRLTGSGGYPAVSGSTKMRTGTGTDPDRFRILGTGTGTSHTGSGSGTGGSIAVPVPKAEVILFLEEKKGIITKRKLNLNKTVSVLLEEQFVGRSLVDQFSSNPVNSTDTILNSLSDDYKPFVVNYNMNNMEKSIAELHTMLKTAELNMGTKNKTKDVLMVRDGGVKKKNGHTSTSKGKGPVQAIQSAPKKGKGKGKGKKVKPNKARTENRCFTCNEVGHWRQNCPKRHEADNLVKN
ncbi:hypothetical protein OSB04_031996 [Centaurea solstitialis]|uniref:CCHC-type domain-containing protein n=1 Tax=Centaurea solstitialis TaxID=347529 RepID=A0AA38SBH0_9ASTR|nr:hypothetical protein OSB04_031996 [Centaurea solstitialis]